ncbi:YadA-like family protein [Dyella subtropica]|uniref:YadA-like family protein n=1 Tax=Dyella subtropica TaxID=2992127 RepID=UPI002256DA58|nr:YadA-like family protein [Dyella subtropica]
MNIIQARNKAGVDASFGEVAVSKRLLAAAIVASFVLAPAAWAQTAVSGSGSNTNGAAAGTNNGNVLDHKNPGNPSPNGVGNDIYDGIKGTAVGDNATADYGGVAVGFQSSAAVNLGSVAIGALAKSTANSAISIGVASLASGDDAIAMGRQSAANGKYSLAFGNVAYANGVSAVAMGDSANAAGYRSIAIGAADTNNANVGLYYDTGSQTKATGDLAVAVGAGSVATGTNSLALGSTAQATYVNDIAIGSQAKADSTLGAGGNTNAIAVGSQTNAQGAYAMALGFQAKATGATATAIGNGSQALATSTIALGDSNVVAAAAGAGSMAMGNQSKANAGNGAVALGYKQTATGNGAVAIGDPNIANGTGAVALGASNVAAGDSLGATAANGALAIGNSNTAIGQGSLALGNSSSATAAGGIAMGDTAQATAGSAVALGSNAIAGNANDVALGSASVTAAPHAGTFDMTGGVAAASSDTNGVLSIGAAGKERQIQNVAAGVLSAASTDAVNGSQLYSVANAFNKFGTSAATALGGGASYNTGTGTFTAPSYTIGSTQYNNVGAALQAINTDLAGVGASSGFVSSNAVTSVQPVAPGSNASAGGYGASAGGANSTVLGNQSTDNGVAGSTVLGEGASIASGLTGSSVALGRGSAVTGDAVATPNGSINGTNYNYAGGAPIGVVSVGSNGNQRQITNVAAGQVTASSTDAVNGSQLYATDQAVNGLGTQLGTLAANAVQYDNASKTSITLGGTGAPAVTLKNVATGGVNATSTDAVNGSQLYATNQQIANITNGKTGPFVSDNSQTSTMPLSSGANATAGGFGASATGADSTVVGNGSTDNGVANATVIGQGASIAAGLAGSNVAIGTGSSVSSAAVATRSGTINGTVYNYAGSVPAGVFSVGSSSQQRQVTNVAAGQVTASSTDAVNGSQLYATNQAMNALGNQVTNVANGTGGEFQISRDRSGNAPTASGTNSAAGGAGAVASGNGSLALGNGSNSSGSNSVAIGTGSTDGGLANVVSVGSSSQQRKVINVGAGAVTATSTDAVNGSQLYQTNQTINNLVNSISTSSGQMYYAADADGAASSATGYNSVAAGPSAKASNTMTLAAGANTTATSVGSTALGAGSTSTGSNSVAIGAGSSDGGQANVVSMGTTNMQRRVTNVAAGVAATDAANVSQLAAVSAASVQYDRNSDGSVNYGSVSVGSAASPAQVHNVADGNAASDAVNVRQLGSGMQTAENWAQSYTDQAVHSLRNHANAGVASAMAMAGLPQAYQLNQHAAAVAVGSFHGESGIAIGVSGISESGRWVYKLNLSSNTRGDTGMSVGAAMTW